MSEIAPPDRCSTGFQTHLERRFTPGRFGGSTIRRVWKPRLLKPVCEAPHSFATANSLPGKHEKRRALRCSYF
jgi:hypothetical protein